MLSLTMNPTMTLNKKRAVYMYGAVNKIHRTRSGKLTCLDETTGSAESQESLTELPGMRMQQQLTRWLDGESNGGME